MFKDGLAELHAKFEKRIYTTTLPFAHDLCEVIHSGINVEAKPAEPRFELIDASPIKQSQYSEARDRKRLGKRIIKAVQSQLEAALKAEADITSKPYATLHKELEDMIEASLEIRKPSTSRPQIEASVQVDQDVVMVDAAEGAHITTMQGGADDEADAGGVDGDKMEVDELSIEVKDEDVAQNSAEMTVGSTADDGALQESEGKPLTNGVKSAPTPPNTNGYEPVAQDSAQPTPLTPPQSNGSLGRETDNTLTDGGVLWYLRPFDPVGTTAVEEQWAGRDAVRALSEELTDMDDEELNDLEFNVEDSTITASPVDALGISDHHHQHQQHLATSHSGRLRSGSSSRRKASGAAAGVNKKRLRSSARRR